MSVGNGAGPRLSEAVAALRREALTSVPTGLPSVDELTLGLMPGDVWLVTGDRALAFHFLLQCATVVARRGLPTRVASFERSADQVWGEFACQWADATPQTLLRAYPTADTEQRLIGAVELASGMDVHVAGPDDAWGLPEWTGCRLLALDGVSPGLLAADAKEFARTGGATVVAACYDDDGPAGWLRHADTQVRVTEAPWEGTEGTRHGEVDLHVRSIKHELQMAGAWPFSFRRHGVPFEDVSAAPMTPGLG